MRKTYASLATVLLGLCLLGAAQGASADTGFEEADQGIFSSADINQDGKISRREILHYTDLVFLSMKSGNGDELRWKEFSGWDAGYLHLAEKMGRTSEFAAAKKEVFSMRDLNGDGVLTYEEFSTSALYDFYKADQNKDGMLSKAEFLGDYAILKTLRAALQ